MSSKEWFLERIPHLNACSAQGMSLRDAAKEMRVNPRTIKQAAKNANMYLWLEKKFPSITRYRSGIRFVSVDEAKNLAVDRNNPYVRAATMPWRGQQNG